MAAFGHGSKCVCINLHRLTLFLLKLAEKENQKMLERKKREEEERRQEEERKRHLEAEKRQMEEEQKRLREKKVSLASHAHM